jgi:molybdopterin-guanine dinucleotide biosynthesis protein B
MNVFGFTGYSGAGKTTLIERLVPLFNERGLRVSTIKHGREDIPFDAPGKDSARHSAAGAGQVLLVSGNRWMLQKNDAQAAPLTLVEQLALLEPCDLVLVEGYKATRIPRICVHREATRKTFPFHELDALSAVASDVALDVPCPNFHLDDVGAIAGFILSCMSLPRSRPDLRLVAAR